MSELVNISELKEHPKNYRQHPEDQLRHIEESIKKFGNQLKLKPGIDLTKLPKINERGIELKVIGELKGTDIKRIVQAYQRNQVL